NIDKLVMIDSGGSNGDGSGTLTRLANTVPTTMFNLMQTAKALGIDLTGLLGKVGIQEEDEGKKGSKKE
ncbi:hypothetical protein HY009_00655, partial [Candidatus Acetothermia bacterium]|nr:hypothetical protein [Candidatus Acetothermia bacterium]